MADVNTKEIVVIEEKKQKKIKEGVQKIGEWLKIRIENKERTLWPFFEMRAQAHSMAFDIVREINREKFFPGNEEIDKQIDEIENKIASGVLERWMDRVRSLSSPFLS